MVRRRMAAFVGTEQDILSERTKAGVGFPSGVRRPGTDQSVRQRARVVFLLVSRWASIGARGFQCCGAYSSQHVSFIVA